MDRLEDPQSLGIMDLGGRQQMTLQVGDLACQVTDELEIDLDRSTDVGIGELLGDPLGVALVVRAPAELGQVALAVGILDVSE